DCLRVHERSARHDLAALFVDVAGVLDPFARKYLGTYPHPLRDLKFVNRGIPQESVYSSRAFFSQALFQMYHALELSFLNVDGVLHPANVDRYHNMLLYT